MASGKNTKKDRRLVHCLLCHKVQDSLPTHLLRVCMKKASPEERLAEVQRAKDSVKKWTRHHRNWDYLELCSLIPEQASRWRMVRCMQENDFFVYGAPSEQDIQDREEATTSTAGTRGTPAVVIRSTEPTATQEAVPAVDRSTAEEASDLEESRGRLSPDSTWLDAFATQWSEVDINMQRLGHNGSTMLTEEQKTQESRYMAHSDQVANEHYWMKTLENAVATANLLAAIGGDSPDEEPAEKKRRGKISSKDNKEQKGFSEFLEEFPVSLHGQPPSKAERVKAGFPQDRSFYDKWRVVQFRERESLLLSKCYRRQPTANKVARMIEKEGWTANHPSAEQILAKWQPPRKMDVETDTALMKRIERQKWSGVAIKFDDNRGEGVVATKRFVKGSIICDYHGELISGEEGEAILQATPQDTTGYLFFFIADGERFCVNAQTNPCKCHPSLETVGRKLNHSRKKPNVKPLHCKIQFSSGAKDTLLLVAAKDIAVGEELRFNYGVNRKSFRGEGLDLEWLDE